MTRERNLATRVIGGVYSWAADKVYEPVVVRTFFPLLGGDLDDALRAQGRRAVDAAAGRPILDMPVGTAHFTLRVAADHPGVVVGVDIAEGMMRAAARAAAEAGADNLSPVQANAHDLPFADGAFGAILCTNGLQVIPGLRPTLDELARVLADDGTLFVSVITLPLTAALGEATAERFPAILRGRRDLIRALADSGLRVVTVRRQRFALLIEATKADPSHPRATESAS